MCGVTLQFIMTDSAKKKPRGGPLFDSTSHYYLKSSYYYQWHREMTTTLLTTRKLRFILETLPKPSKTNVEEYEAWITCHGVIRQRIWNSASKDIASQVRHIDDQQSYGLT